MKNIKLLLGIIVGVFGLWSQAQGQDQHSLLWLIEGNGIQPSYVYGTMHLLPKEKFDLAPKVKDAFEASEQIVLELDMDEPSLQTEIMKHIPMSDGQTLDKLMSEQSYQKLDETLKQTIGAGAQMFNTWKPIGITSMLYISYLGGQPASFEATFVNMAKEQNKEILGLETVEEQMQVFENIPYSEQIKDIEDLLFQTEASQAALFEMVELYLQEDVSGLYEFTAQFLDTEAEQHFMLDERNQNWVPLIGKLAADESTFFGVGAAHLGGEQGVLSLLKQAGYSVTPVQ